MSQRADPRVDAYIDALPDWQQAICREVRELVHAADPEVAETIKRTTRPYFVLQGNICALLAAKDHVNVFLYDGAIVPDPEGIITAGHENKTARTVAVRRGETINAPALSARSPTLRHLRHTRPTDPRACHSQTRQLMIVVDPLQIGAVAESLGGFAAAAGPVTGSAGRPAGRLCQV
jgi:hypothetical protein